MTQSDDCGGNATGALVSVPSAPLSLGHSDVANWIWHFLVSELRNASSLGVLMKAQIEAHPSTAMVALSVFGLEVPFPNECWT